MINRLVPLLLLLIPAAAESADSRAPIVFIHGIKGSRLVGPGGEVGWVNRWQVAGLSTPDLTFRQDHDPWRVDGVLDYISLVPVLWKQPIYGPWLTAARGVGTPFYEFAYDWRRDCQDTLFKFESFIDQVRARHAGQPVRVVAHSMGGLITWAALHRQPDRFESIVLAGVPFGGSIDFLQDLTTGVATGMNSKILGPAVLRTFPSIYVLLPSGVMEPVLSRELLARAKPFRDWAASRPTKVPPLLVIAGVGQATLDTPNAPRVPGDGRIALAHALPPAGIEYELVQTPVEHSQLLNDPAVISRILSWRWNR